MVIKNVSPSAIAIIPTTYICLEVALVVWGNEAQVQATVFMVVVLSH